MGDKDKYEYILSNVYSLLCFAETKNGFLLTILAGLTLFVNESNWFTAGRLIIINVLLGLPIAILVSSFFPRFSKKSFFAEDYKKVDKTHFNVLNIQDLSAVPDDLLKKKELDNYIGNYDISIQRQIGFNSMIAMKKFRAFSLAVFFSCIALVGLIVLLL